MGFPLEAWRSSQLAISTVRRNAFSWASESPSVFADALQLLPPSHHSDKGPTFSLRVYQPTTPSLAIRGQMTRKKEAMNLLYLVW